MVDQGSVFSRLATALAAGFSGSSAKSPPQAASLNGRLCILLLLGWLPVSTIFAQDKQLRNLPPAETPRFQVKDRDWLAKPGEASICLWKDDKLAAATISIDDNWVTEHSWWTAEAEKRGFKFTWFVISDRVGTGPNWGTWADFQKLREQGHDVQSHSTTHFNPAVPGSQETQDVYKDAIPAIEKGVPGVRVQTLAYPGGPNSKNDPAIAAKYYTASRGGRGLINPANQINYLDVCSVGNGLPSDGRNWATVQHLTNPANKLFRGWGCMHFHGLENSKEPEKAAKINAVKIMDYLKAHEADIWVGTFTEVTCYGQQRDTAKLTAKFDGKTVKLSITDDMDDKLFDTPLTVKVRLDPAWAKITARQGDKAVDVKMIEKDGAKFALAPVVPDKGEVVLSAE